MASVVDKTTPRGTGGGKWKARLGIGRRNNNNSNAATPVAANAAARHSNTTTSSSSNHTPPPEEADHGEARSLASSKRLQQQRIAASKQNAAKAHQHQHSQQRSNFMKKLNIKTSFRKSSQESRDASESPPSNPQSPISTSSFATVESELERNQYRRDKIDSDLDETLDELPSHATPRNTKRHNGQIRQQQELYDKQRQKERDGFCRRVDTYDGSVIVVDATPTYEIGNYLGGGVAGVVYQGHRLRPIEEYPIRMGINDNHEFDTITATAADEDPSNQIHQPQQPIHQDSMTQANGAMSDGEDEEGFFCSTTGEGGYLCGDIQHVEPTHQSSGSGNTPSGGAAHAQATPRLNGPKKILVQEQVDLAIEATMTQNENVVMLDAQDAPSRSRHFTKAASVKVTTNGKGNKRANTARQRSLNHGLTDEAVAIKILNPVGFRILQNEGLKGAVVVKKGDAMEAEVKKGVKPMEERHVWWIVNPNSRNLRTLQRYNGKDNAPGSKSVQIDRGSKSKGLRLSLIAAYVDPRTNKLRELTLTRCIEIWGHIPFIATDLEFEDMLTAIERINAGQPPPPVNAFARDDDHAPGRVGTDVTGTNSTTSEDPMSVVPFQSAPTGLLRAALSQRATVYCGELNAYIAIPAVPSKYIRWLRQRRAATKEVRNMMSIGRHKNVLHLFEVLEFIQETKSTMFLILELVKGGELFDLISSSAGKNRKSTEDTEQTERMMRKFFYELASGINYCHKNGIAHRDLKPENLLVHNGPDGQSTLKIADFGLSAAFGPNRSKATHFLENETMLDSIGSPMSTNSGGGDSAFSNRMDGGLSPRSLGSVSSVKDSMDKFIASGASALSFLTCGAMETVLCIPKADDESGPSPLRRMTSVVGSPHYVAPEIISQNEDKVSGGTRGGGVNNHKSVRGYDGTKADVWSAGVILYAMLFRSLPFGEDLLRCPRYQSYRKWYDEVREMGGRRSSSYAALNPNISDAEERDYLGPHWFFPAATSRVSRDLIVAMLNPKPEDRLSVAQVLEHPWVAAAAKEMGIGG